MSDVSTPLTVVKLVAFNAGLFAVLLASLELVSYGILSLSYNEQPMFFAQLETYELPSDSVLLWKHDSAVISGLGFQHRHGCIITSTEIEVSRDHLKILVSGGSTTDVTFDELTWSSFLLQKLKDNKVPSTIYNAAVAGYNSTQELSKIDQLVLTSINPDVIITYSGVNEDMGYNRMNQTVSFSGSFAINRILPNLMGLFYYRLPRNVEKHFSEDNSVELAHLWLKNIRQMKTLTEEHGIYFVSVLQPALGIGKYTRSEREEGILTPTYYEEFYRTLGDMIDNKPYIHDLTDVFADTSGVFLDDCHLTKEGNEIISDAIFNVLVKEGVITIDSIDI